ncbi:MAG: DNA-protecting protein DprA [Ruminococcaceae bacterium]|nr:DNA-protecting protein DprA [Oscillospiraceae bacterium]
MIQMILNEYSTLYWLWLQNLCGEGSVLPEILISHFGSIKDVYEADEQDYEQVSGITARSVKKLADKSLDRAREILAYCKNEGVGILTPDSALYPKRLSRIPCKPAVLYYKGVMVDLDREVCIAEVGTREMTEYGSRTAYTMAYDMARGGAVVVSGMAKGVDGMAHRGALDAGGYTVAVLGCGIDRAYPSEHIGLMKEIIGCGVVMTEYRPFTPPIGRNFPMRNRILSGLSLGTLVIEAPKKSGALITAETALKQGRDVFALPGKVGEMSSEGSNHLIRNGAKMVTGATDILVEYQNLYPTKIDLNKITAIKSRNFAPGSFVATELPNFSEKRGESAEKRASVSEKKMTKPEKEVKEEKTYTLPTDAEGKQLEILTLLMNEGEMTSDMIASKTGSAITDILVELTMLEIMGHISANPGGTYKLS